MIADFKFITFWWLTIFFLGSISLPLIFHIFRKFWDKGYIFSKIVSVATLTYIIFVLGVFKFLPFTNSSIFAVIFIALLANLYYLSRPGNLPAFKKTFKKNYRTFIFEEIIFFLILAAWSYVRGYSPRIEGLEKFMDWGFVNSALRSRFMPPVDMWFSGQPINYYYFGHLIFALLTKISGISSAITYNLAIAVVCALTFTSVFSLSSNLVYLFIKKFKLKTIIIAGLTSALLATFGGNLHAVYKIAKINIKNNGQLTLTSTAISQAAGSYWYPDATRFIGFDPDVKDKTIHEFPIYSFVVADLHGHMNDIPLMLFFMAFLLASCLPAVVAKSLISWRLILPSALVLSLAFMTNAWDFGVYGLLFAVFTLFFNLFKHKLKTAIPKTLANGILVVLFWYLFTLPFSLNFEAMTEGLKLSDSHSPFYQLFILHGGFWLINIPFLYIFFSSAKNKIKTSDIFVLALIVTATLLIIFPEIAFLKDIYIYDHRRANTMFKLVYQSFIMYSLSSGYVLVRLISRLKPGLKFIYKLVFLLVFSAHLIYPYFAIKSYYGLKDYQGLWGLDFLEKANPDNLAAINWINQNIAGQPVMLEAVGDSYTTFNQVSTATGLPTVEGWMVHEWLWRGGYDQPSARQNDVAQIYESTDHNTVRSLLQKYAVDYIFVGDKEVEKYPNLNEDNFIQLGFPIIAQFGQTRIYKIPK